MSSAPPPPGGGGDGRAVAAAAATASGGITHDDPPPSSVGARALAAASSREDTEAAARAAMPPPPPRERPRRPPPEDPVVLEEEQWTSAIEAIVERDYFPELPRLQSRLEWLRAVRSGDPSALRRAQANAAARRAGLRTPGPGADASLRGGGEGWAETPPSVTGSEVGGWTPVSRASSHAPGGAAATPPAGAGGGGTGGREPTWGAESVAGDDGDPSERALQWQQQLRAPPVSLDDFLAGHTSEDNASFAAAMRAAAVRRLEGLEARFGPGAAAAAAAAAAAGATRDLFIGGAAGAPAVAAIEAAAAGAAAPPSGSLAVVAAAAAAAAGGGGGGAVRAPAPRQRPSARPLTNAAATRFAAPGGSRAQQSVGASTFSGMDTPVSGSGSGGGLSLASGGSGSGFCDSPYAERGGAGGHGGNGAAAASAAAAVPRQYRRLETPDLLPGGGAGGGSAGGGGASPFITWGELAATPVRLDGAGGAEEDIEGDARALAAATAAADGGPRFSMPAPRQRERLAATLGGRARGRSGGAADSLAARGGGVRGGPRCALAAAPSPSPRLLSPAALRLASTLGRRSATPAAASSDLGLRASYGGGGGGGGGGRGGGGRATPLRHDGGSRRSASATPLPPPPPPDQWKQ